MISALKKVNVKIRKFKVENFKEICAFSKNLCVGKTLLKSGFGAQTTGLLLPDGTVVSSLFSLGKTIFFQSEDGAFYQFTQEGAKLIKTVDGQVYGVCEIEKNGQKTALILCENPFTLDGESVENLPKAKHAVLHEGRLYLADKNTVFVGRPFDFELRAQPLESSCTLGINSKAGEIVGFFAKGEKLFVICQKAIYLINPSSNAEDFNFERLSFTGLNIKNGTLATFGGECAFISSNKLVRFSGSSINKIDTLLDGFKATIYNAYADGENYFLTLKIKNGSEFVYRYNLLEDEQELINLQSIRFANGGFTVKENQIVKLSNEVKSVEEKSFLTREIDLNDCDRKTLCGVDINVYSACTLTVKGIFGAKKYSLKKGRNALCVNLTSDAYALELNSNGREFGVQSLTLFYRLKGE